jgi:nitrite reductase/ring-hydroxylating ferredoxin subunit/uncharacterized membrane protein
MAEDLVDRVLRRQDWMEGWGDAIQTAVGWVFKSLGPVGTWLKDILHGTKVLGHPLHPALTDVPLGAWSAGVVADFAAHYFHQLPPVAGDFALLVGFLAGLGAGAAGYTDFHETYAQERRVALTHGLTMTFVLLLDVISLWIRFAGGNRALGVGIATVALALAIFGGYLGGHLVFGFGTMVNHDAFAEAPEDFVAVGKPADFAEGKLVRVMAGEMPVLVVRLNGKLNAIANTCTHAGGPLNEGSLAHGEVTCPWHASVFRLADGRVKHGPATFDAPLFTVREHAGKVEVKPAQPLH